MHLVRSKRWRRGKMMHLAKIMHLASVRYRSRGKIMFWRKIYRCGGRIMHLAKKTRLGLKIYLAKDI